MKNDEAYLAPEGEELPKNEAALRQGVAGFEFQGKALEPYCAGRRMAADAMGLKFGKFSPTEAAKMDALAKLMEENPDNEEIDFTPFLYPGVVLDVAMVVCLCSKPRSFAMKAMRKPDWGMEEVATWADKAGLIWPSEAFTEGYKLFMQLIANVNAGSGKFKAQPNPDGKAPKKVDRPKN